MGSQHVVLQWQFSALWCLLQFLQDAGKLGWLVHPQRYGVHGIVKVLHVFRVQFQEWGKGLHHITYFLNVGPGREGKGDKPVCVSAFQKVILQNFQPRSTYWGKIPKHYPPFCHAFLQFLAGESRCETNRYSWCWKTSVEWLHRETCDWHGFSLTMEKWNVWNHSTESTQSPALLAPLLISSSMCVWYVACLSNTEVTFSTYLVNEIQFANICPLSCEQFSGHLLQLAHWAFSIDLLN